ncbi:hypothetical protein EYF80_037748 [Liparis tanakae]|uniref:Uncharacterized protein n=1 Tax=Liparis tanakae TaxID=230148 RepID=A0A4Z2GGL8_9TELE|nr:hypothetical protein EYF80_037748 [Liparis tanakae]
MWGEGRVQDQKWEDCELHPELTCLSFELEHLEETVVSSAGNEALDEWPLMFCHGCMRPDSGPDARAAADTSSTLSWGLPSVTIMATLAMFTELTRAPASAVKAFSMAVLMAMPVMVPEARGSTRASACFRADLAK